MLGSGYNNSCYWQTPVILERVVLIFSRKLTSQLLFQIQHPLTPLELKLLDTSMSYLVVYVSVLIHWIWLCKIVKYTCTHNIDAPIYLVLVFHSYSYNHVCYTFPLLYSVPWQKPQNQKIDPGGKKVNWKRTRPNRDNPLLHMTEYRKMPSI